MKMRENPVKMRENPAKMRENPVFSRDFTKTINDRIRKNATEFTLHQRHFKTTKPTLAAFSKCARIDIPKNDLRVISFRLIRR